MSFGSWLMRCQAMLSAGGKVCDGAKAFTSCHLENGEKDGRGPGANNTFTATPKYTSLHSTKPRVTTATL